MGVVGCLAELGLRATAGRQWFLRSALITSLTDEIINRTVLAFANTPIGCSTCRHFSKVDNLFSDGVCAVVIAWIFELAGGAIGDFEDNCLPKEQREAAWTVAVLHQWDVCIDDSCCIIASFATGYLKSSTLQA